jgi:hypothetical protein
MQVPTYAKYIRDILNKKEPLPTRRSSSWLKSVVRQTWIHHPSRKRIQDAPLQSAPLEISTSTMHSVILE